VVVGWFRLASTIAAPFIPLEVRSMRKFFRSEEGIAVTEYGLLIALVAIALIAVVTVFGTQISAWFATKTGQITTV
jgi:pilus assembly protein Flp/PilA